ncbi:hypothetical protein ANO11243_072250 [Dothideomycetidae sp. 11243]|nr:hypothetical protein ANO11243_072250 [fungal sp. No.11243]
MHFSKGREPMQSHSSLQLDDRHTKGPVPFLNPTQTRFKHFHKRHHHSEAGSDDGDSPDRKRETRDHEEPEQAASKVDYKWTSRNNRKGRHALVISQTAANSSNAHYATPPPSTSWSVISRTILKMFIYYPVWDVSWLVAYTFTWGSIVWVLNSFFVFLPLLAPSTEFSGEIADAGGWTAFVGATIFVFGSILLMFEAVNSNKSGCFGWAVEQVYDDHFKRHGAQNALPSEQNGEAEKGAVLRIRPDSERCSHHHTNKHNIVGKPDVPDDEPTDSTGGRSWTWFPSKNELTTHYMHELGFIASFIQLWAATIFWISGFTAIPGIYNRLSTGGVNGAYWVPQVIGGFGFILSGFLFMLETQEIWYKPALRTLGWYIGLFNFIGGWGFFLCPCFGFNTASWSVYQASCSTFWGSWAFLIGSALQLYESLNKHPVEVDKKENKE